MAKDQLSDEDKALFRRMVQDVEPLDKCKTNPQKKERLSLHVPPCSVNHPPTKIDRFLSNHYLETVGIDTLLSYCQPSIPRHRLNQLKRGEICPQARLDLHGFRPDEARERLCDFLEKQLQMQHRCVLIIHGKGSRGGEAPILKNLVHHWLPQISLVMAYHSAIPRDGGTGAIYVLIKRDRHDNY
jgi:DNA-nicking Smr family endonuclease